VSTPAGETSVRDREESVFYLAAGAIAAILLGPLLVPLRDTISASNLAFAYIALTIAVAELGGRGAAVCTAIGSALSFNFFLTKPYLRLTIHDRQDVIAFVGLAVVGLIAAAFGAKRARDRAELTETRRHLEMLAALARWQSETEEGTGLDRALEACCSGLSLAAMAVRDARGYVTAASAVGYGSDLPSREFEIDALPATVGAEGVRIRLAAFGSQVGWLDLWGGGDPLGSAARRTVTAAACLISVRLAARADAP
jgi:hypothetical protein